MIRGRGGHRRQVRDVAQLVPGLEPRGVEVHHRRDQDQAVHRDVVEAALELVDHGRRSRGPVAFPADVLRRGPALVRRDPGANELGDGLSVLAHAPELLALVLAEWTAVPGPDRIDEDEVRDVEDRERVVLHQERWCAVVLRVAGDHDALRSECTHVQPYRRGARAAVPQERHRAFRRVRDAVLDVGDRKNTRLRLAVLVLQVGFARRRDVLHHRAAELPAVRCREHLRRWDLRRFLRRGRLVGERWSGAEDCQEADAKRRAYCHGCTSRRNPNRRAILLQSDVR